MTHRSRPLIAGASLLFFLCFLLCFLLFFLFVGAAAQTPASPVSPAYPDLSHALKWRLIGPFRGGRVLAVSGVAGHPETFYFGAVGGGLWKTTDGGQVWNPIFDGQPIASIGALAVAPSDPNTVYVGTGEADMRSDISFGNGVYKSTDAGATWKHIGLAGTRQIGRIVVDPASPDTVLVAALGHGFGPNAERGVFRSSDGGSTWAQVLHRDENTGAIDLAPDPDDFHTIYAALWNTRRPPWSTYAPSNGPGAGLFKSTDAGVTWKELTGHGLPSGKLGRIGVAVAAGGRGRRVYALIDAEHGGLYRSDDAGANWQLVGTDRRIDSRPWYFSGVTVDPRNPDIVYISNVSIYRSLDGGRTFQAFKGAPGGDDYHSLWIDPNDPARMISGNDQGAIVSVDGGRTWSSWYNQPTAQFYHVAVDNQFPYTVYGAQQDSGTAAVSSRGDFGQITYREWRPVGAGESGYLLPSLTDPDIVFGGSTGGELYRCSKRTGQVQDISPTPPSPGNAKARYPWTAALAISPLAPHALYQCSQFVYKSTDEGTSWTTISPDLTVPRGGPNEGKAVIYTIAPSPLNADLIWAGTDNGIIQLTRDAGKTWQDVTPPGLASWSMISIIHASALDPAAAYVAVDRHQMDDLRPYIYRTHDYGKTWTAITQGISEPAYVHVVREDPLRKGLLFAGTETGVYVSADDGDNWEHLQLNLPVVPVRDLVIKDNDLVVATHGRSFWILDDISPLRALGPPILPLGGIAGPYSSPLRALGPPILPLGGIAGPYSLGGGVRLLTPATAVRVRANENRDTPLPPETPVGTNPPAGAVIDYLLNGAPASSVTLEIRDSAGRPVRTFSSSDEPPKVEDVLSFPTYWLHPPAPLSRRAGLNRFVWDLRYAPPPALSYNYGIAASITGGVRPEPEGPLVLPGVYQVRLSVDGHAVTVPLTVKMDPRVDARGAALEQQLALEMKIAADMALSFNAFQQIREVYRQAKELRERLGATADSAAPAGEIDALQKRLEELAGVGDGSADVWPPPPETALRFDRLNGGLAGLMTAVGTADRAPTKQQAAAFADYHQVLTRQLAVWDEVRARDLAQLNTTLQRGGLAAITVPAAR